MKIIEVKKYLKEKKLFDDCDVRRLGFGNNYQVFLVEAGGEKFTLRMGRDDVVVQNNLRDEYRNLKFLETQGIDFVPRVKFFDVRKKILMLSYVDGEEIGVNDMSGAQLKQFVDKIDVLQRIKFSDYKKYCKKNNFYLREPETQMQHIRRSGVKRLYYIKKNCDDLEWIIWLDERLKENLEFVKSIKASKSDIIFNHGDLAGANIFLNKKELTFIDWDKAKFLHNEDFGIGYMFIHGEIEDLKLRKRIIKLFAKAKGMDVRDLEGFVNKWLRVTKINDIIWAVMMHVKMKDEGFSNAERYIRLARKRRREYEEMEG